MTLPNTLPEPLLGRIIKVIHGEPELDGCMIGYSHAGARRVIHKGTIPTRNALEKFVVVEYAPVPAGTVKLRTLPTQSTTVTSLPAYKQNLGQLGPELIGLGCSLMCFTFSAAGVAAGTAGTAATGPVGAAVAVACWTGLVTSGIQAYNGIARFWQIAVDPYGTQLAQWDTSDSYGNFILAVDAIGVLSGAGAMAIGALGILKVLRARSSLKAATPQALAAMDKATRERVLRQAYAEITSTPEGQRELAAALKAAKITLSGAGKARHSQKVAGVISAAAQHRLQHALTDQLIGAVGIGFSGLPGVFAGSASGSVFKYVTDPGSAWLASALSVHVLHRGDAH